MQPDSTGVKVQRSALSCPAPGGGCLL